MLNKLKTLREDIASILVYCDSSSLEVIVKNILRDRFNINKDFSVTVNKIKDIKRAKLDAFVLPLSGDKWLINVEVDDLSKKDLKDTIAQPVAFGVVVYWTSNYGIYKFLKESEEFKHQGVHFFDIYLGRVDMGDIKEMYKVLVNKKVDSFPSDLFLYLHENYRNDPQAISDLFTLIKSGNEVKLKRDIIELIGIGGSSVDSLVISLLTTSCQTQRGLKRVLKTVLNTVNDLAVSYNYTTLKNFMVSTLDGIIEMKELMIMGYYTKYIQKVPDNYNFKKIKRLKRYEYVIFNKITLPRALSLRSYLKAFNDFNAEIVLIQALSLYE